ncbi:MAG: hypothetical protein WC815_15305 [Vicinamibacterales bacterium]
MALNLVVPGAGLELRFQDNYLSLGVEADSIQDAIERGEDVVDLLCQALSVHYGVRFSASLRHLEDSEGNPKQLVRPRAIPLMDMASFNLEELKDRIGIAFNWAQTVDDRARKALLYFEHACLLREFSQSLELFSPHVTCRVSSDQSLLENGPFGVS